MAKLSLTVFCTLLCQIGDPVKVHIKFFTIIVTRSLKIDPLIR